MPTFSFLILTYNSSLYISNFFSSLFEVIGSQIEEGRAQVIIVDNASADDSVIRIKKSIDGKKNFVLLTEKINLGYAKGINRAAQHATGELLVVINPDSELLNFDSEKIEEEFKKDSRLAITGLSLIDYEGRKEKTAGNFFNAFSFFLYAAGLENIASSRFVPEKSATVDFVSGGFVVFRNKFFKDLHGYDEDYFMYVEDMDICFRAKKEGFLTKYLPYATIKHRGQGSSNREFAIVNIYKGLQLFYAKHESFISVLYIKNLLSIKAALIIFMSILLGKKELLSTYQKALKTIT